MQRIRLNVSSTKLSAKGFTLVELLVVIGIIALLISILLPALNKARNQANATSCLSNIRQIASAFLSYTIDNRGYFPGPAANSGVLAYDWITWQVTPSAASPLPASIATTGIGPYLKLSPNNFKVMICPGDDGNRPFLAAMGNTSKYFQFSYTFNWWFSSNPNTNTSPGGIHFPKITMVRNTSEKIIVIEEDERTIDDGQCSVWQSPASNFEYINLLSDRHDTVFRTRSDGSVTYPVGQRLSNGTAEDWIPNSQGRGNVGFCDGHAEFVPRTYAQTYEHTVGDPAAFTSAELMDPPMK